MPFLAAPHAERMELQIRALSCRHTKLVCMYSLVLTLCLRESYIAHLRACIRSESECLWLSFPRNKTASRTFNETNRLSRQKLRARRSDDAMEPTKLHFLGNSFVFRSLPDLFDCLSSLDLCAV
mmetsp:Transcript_43988/g.106876  ORF Transcript_43988/g.106876 Transcript_43988/m.106876 type:complete len:124 (+) Transcript_43988:525-896(+)